MIFLLRTPNRTLPKVHHVFALAKPLSNWSSSDSSPIQRIHFVTCRKWRHAVMMKGVGDFKITKDVNQVSDSNDNGSYPPLHHHQNPGMVGGEGAVALSTLPTAKASWIVPDARPLLPAAAFFMGDLRDGLPMVSRCG